MAYKTHITTIAGVWSTLYPTPSKSTGHTNKHITPIAGVRSTFDLTPIFVWNYKPTLAWDLKPKKTQECNCATSNCHTHVHGHHPNKTVLYCMHALNHSQSHLWFKNQPSHCHILSICRVWISNQCLYYAWIYKPKIVCDLKQNTTIWLCKIKMPHICALTSSKQNNSILQ